MELKNVEEEKMTFTSQPSTRQEMILNRNFHIIRTQLYRKRNCQNNSKDRLFNSSNQIPIVKWDGITDDNLLCVQVKIDDGEYKELGKLQRRRSVAKC